MSIEKTSNAIDRAKQSAADARQVEEAAERDCENLNAQIEVVRANETEEITNSVETTVKAIDSNLRSAVEEKVERPADEAQTTAAEYKEETFEDIRHDQEAMSALDGINTTTIDVSSEVGETKSKITETLQTSEDQVESLDSIAQEAMDIFNSASQIELD